MPIDSYIRDGETGVRAKVTKQGILATGNLDFSVPVEVDLAVNDQVYNFFKPLAGKILIITDVILNADRNVGQNGTIVDIYAAVDSTSSTITTQVFKFDLIKQGQLVLTGLNVKLNEGKFLNAKCDDNNVLLTIAGFFAPA